MQLYIFFPICYILPHRQGSVPDAVRFSANVDPTRRHLCLQFLGGKAFLEHLQEPEPLPGHVQSTFTIHINFRGQRFKSRPTPCACEPDFKESFLLELHKESKGWSVVGHVLYDVHCAQLRSWNSKNACRCVVL